MVDVTNKPQIVEHIHKSLTQTVYETKWIPTSARFVLLGSPPRQSGMIQLYNLVKGDAELVAELAWVEIDPKAMPSVRPLKN